MRSPSKIIGGLAYFGCVLELQNGNRQDVRLCLSKNDMTFSTNQATYMVAVSQIMCTSLPNSRITSVIGPLTLCLKFGEASKPRGEMLRKLKIATCNVILITDRSMKLVGTLRKRKVNATCM